MQVKTYQNNFKHKDNIKSIIDRTGLTSIIPKDCHCYLGGGYAAALLFAPRRLNDTTALSENYYSDIDLFFSTSKDFDSLHNVFELLRSTQAVRKVTETENAITYMLYTFDENGGCNGANDIQLIKKYVGTPKEILSTFDILNARILYSFKENVWHADANAFPAFASKKISLTDHTPLLEEKDGIFFQLERLAKYISRYDLELNNETLYRLIKLNKQYPDLSFEKNKKVEVRGYYSRYSKTVSETFNVWTAFNNMFLENRHWSKIEPLVSNIQKLQTTNDYPAS